MSMIKVKLLDLTGTKISDVMAPNDVQVQRLIVLLVEKLKMPIHSPDGQIISYKLHHKQTGMQLMDHQTLAEAGIEVGDELRLFPEITAG